jgi:hypothetical protein
MSQYIAQKYIFNTRFYKYNNIMLSKQCVKVMICPDGLISMENEVRQTDVCEMVGNRKVGMRHAVSPLLCGTSLLSQENGRLQSDYPVSVPGQG